MQITVETQVKAPLNKVWQAYTTPSDITQWNAASDDWHTVKASVDLKEGGEFCSRMEAKDGSFGFDFKGVYTSIKPEALIEYTFDNRQAQVSFDEQGDYVDVKIAFDSEDSLSVDQQEEGWKAILDNFKRYVEAA